MDRVRAKFRHMERLVDRAGLLCDSRKTKDTPVERIESRSRRRFGLTTANEARSDKTLFTVLDEAGQDDNCDFT